MLQQIKNLSYHAKGFVAASTRDPFYNTDLSINVPTVVLVVFGILFILLGIAIFFMYPKQRDKLQKYKKEQLEEFRQNNPKKKHLPYEHTGLYIPSWERMKRNAPLILGMAFLGIGVVFIVGKVFSFF